ncbi:DUF2500 domain-containing protein [Cohnella endophytica]|uniref:DUF2500 domain-containing protein n=1 Tax=Cohnella endophytica TaxID=2419778 RepID=A0A494Y262_9BACL|nr:DUF2500 domain-containing protein [Cohnella endophytica]RKP56847.1 DUF2500 domain-containing protein [Cohnella endophytica]
MGNFGEPSGFWGFISEVPLFFKIFGGILITLVVGTFLFIIVKGLRIWLRNNASELRTVNCFVVDKRTEVWGGSGDSSATTNYYVTFEMDDRSRIELPVHGKQYGMLASGDQGALTYQGTRFKEFKRA